MYYVYLLKSKNYNEIYIGSTNDLKRRLLEHNNGMEISTKRYKPWEIFYYEAYPIETLARLREKRLKHNGNALRELKKRIGIAPFKKNKSGAGFTLIELLVVAGIIILLTAIVVPNYRGGEKQLALQRSASKLTQDFRRAQEMAMSSKEFGGQIPQGGYGLSFLKIPIGGIDFPHQYILFADLNKDGSMNLPSEEVERINLEKGVKFSEFYLDGQSALGSTVIFIAPDPKTCIGTGCANNSTRIVLSLEDDLTINQAININSAGLVAIE